MTNRRLCQLTNSSNLAVSYKRIQVVKYTVPTGQVSQMTLEEVKEMQNYGPHTSGCMAKPPPAIPSHSRNALVIVSHTWNAILFISGNVADSNPTFFSWHWQFAFCIGESLYVIM